MGEDQAQKIFDNAEIFHLAYQLLNKQGIIIPSVVNGALAIELYLKCLYMLEKQKREKIHDLERIFDKLSIETKKTLEENFESSINKKEVKESLSEMERISKIKSQTNFRTFLEETGKVFVRARYFFEREQFSFHCYPQIREVLLKRITELNSNIRTMGNLIV